MAKLELRVAYYADGTVDQGKTEKKTFNNDGLVAVVSLFLDGSRELEYSKYNSVDEITDIGEKIAYLMSQARLEFKSDGGTTPEIDNLVRERKK